MFKSLSIVGSSGFVLREVGERYEWKFIKLSNGKLI